MSLEHGKYLKDLTIEGASLLGGAYKNFGGNPSRFNSKGGDRNFAIRLNTEDALDLIEQGYPVKKREPREEGDEPLYFLKVAVRFKSDGSKKDPVLYRGIDPNRMVLLQEREVGKLDNDEIENIDVTIHYWCREDRDGEWKATGYLTELYALIKQSKLAGKYNSVSDVDSDEETEGDLPF